MKKTFLFVVTFILVACLAFSLSACLEDDTVSSEPEKEEISSDVVESDIYISEPATTESSDIESEVSERPITFTSSKSTSASSKTSSTVTSSAKPKSTSSVASKKTVSQKPASQPTVSKSSGENKNTIVYTTETGKKYHSSKNCSGLSNAKKIFEKKLSEAESLGLTPCLKCH